MKLDSDLSVAESQALRFTALLDDSFRSGHKLDPQTALGSTTPKKLRFSDVVWTCHEIFLHLELEPVDIQTTPI